MNKYLVQGILAFFIFSFSFAGIWFDFFAKYALQIVGMQLSLILALIIYSNHREEKREENYFKKFESIVVALIEKFKGKDEVDSHYVKSIENAKKVEDLTWAPFDRAGEGAVPANYVNRIRKAAEKGTDFDEIFIFNNKEDYRKDRLAKLKYHYDNVDKRQRNNQYSCYYFDIRNFDFPRIQFTIIDEDEIIFTSGRNTRFRIKSEELVNVFSDYYREAINKAKPLIKNGKVVNKLEIEELIKRLDD